MSHYRVSVGQDYVRIANAAGEEQVYWDEAEWKQDPSLVGTIVVAVNLALTQPALFAHRLEQGKSKAP